MRTSVSTWISYNSNAKVVSLHGQKFLTNGGTNGDTKVFGRVVQGPCAAKELRNDKEGNMFMVWHEMRQTASGKLANVHVGCAYEPLDARAANEIKIALYNLNSPEWVKLKDEAKKLFDEQVEESHQYLSAVRPELRQKHD